MAKTYKGKYRIKKPKKYMGDPKNVTYRSLWERQAFRWCEDRDDKTTQILVFRTQVIL